MWKNESTASNERAGLHPLLTAAAVSVTVFSAVGVGVLTGLLPASFGSNEDAAPAAIVAPAAPVKPENVPPAVPTPQKVVKKVTVAPAAGSSPVSAPVRPALASTKTTVEAPKPVPAGMLGVVASVREVKEKAAESNGVGPIAGGIAGAVLGNQLGKGTTRKVLTVLGAAGGALAGKEIERNVRATSHWEIAVRLDDGSERTLRSDTEPYWTAGDRVRLLDGRLQPA